MQIISTDQPQIINRRQRRNVIRTFRINVFAVIVILLAAVALITTVIIAVNAGKYVKTDKKTYYCVQFAQLESLSEAQTKAEEIAAAGGAGYIVNDGGFRVIGACFESRQDAETVAQKQSGGVSVYALTIKKTKRPLIGDRAVSTRTVTILNRYTAHFSGLFAVMRDYDAGEQSESVMLSALTAVRRTIAADIETLTALYGETGRAELTAAIVYYESLNDALYTAAVSATGTLSARIKHVLVKMLSGRAELSETINALKV